MDECQHHSNCGGYCETTEEIEQALCCDCLLADLDRYADDAALKLARIEVPKLRAVYEAARCLLRFNGVDERKTIDAIAALDDAIEQVKEFDSGQCEAL